MRRGRSLSKDIRVRIFETYNRGNRGQKIVEVFAHSRTTIITCMQEFGVRIRKSIAANIFIRIFIYIETN
ncbi:hypothetical protein HZS_500 [Henneguya salminicola]|nr:hypothetical protein HZS_500 [Henneguya salminicola]